MTVPAATEGTGVRLTGWQPIETAPKDGTEVLAVFSHDYGYQDKPTVYGPWTVSFWRGLWVSSWDGQRVISSQSDFGTDYRDPDIEPTHWMPLPEPPAGRQALSPVEREGGADG